MALRGHLAGRKLEVPGSPTLRSEDVRVVDQLVGECRELGSEPSRWHRHMARWIARLFGILLVSTGEGLASPQGAIEVVSAYAVSEDSAAERIHGAYHRAGGISGDPCFHALASLVGPDRQITRSRRELVADDVWYRSPSFEEFRYPAAIDQAALSILTLPGGAVSAISLHRALGERDLTEREFRLFELIHSEIGRSIGGPLVGQTEPGPERLSRRLRQTLSCLLEGDGEKQVAARLDLSPTTVHQYVTALYRHFGVHSRAQLLAHAAKRLSREPWQPFRAGLNGHPIEPFEPDPESLSPRLRQTLACLLDGDSEKQVAWRLDLSPTTVHQYVAALYRHFDVRSRAQLLAFMARRSIAGVHAPLTGTSSV